MPNLDRVCGHTVTHVGKKNHNIEAYLDAALQVYEFGLPFDNNEFLGLVDYLRLQRRRRK